MLREVLKTQDASSWDLKAFTKKFQLEENFKAWTEHLKCELIYVEKFKAFQIILENFDLTSNVS